jgi:hypothetical protein
VHTFGLRLRDETVRDHGTDSGLASDARPHLSGAAGVRICACRRRRAHQRERQHYGGECCRGSHCDSHCGTPSGRDCASCARQLLHRVVHGVNPPSGVPRRRIVWQRPKRPLPLSAVLSPELDSPPTAGTTRPAAAARPP